MGMTSINHNNLKDKIYFQYESRDYEGQELILKRNDNLIFEISEFESNDLNPNILIFLNYAIRQKEFTFTCGSITSELNLSITPSTFGKLLRKNLDNLENLGSLREMHILLRPPIYSATCL